MKCLVISDTFPNRNEPSRGPYYHQQVEALAELCEAAVIDPIPWPRGVRHPGLLGCVRNSSDSRLRNVRLAHPLHIHTPLLGRPMLGDSQYAVVASEIWNEGALQA
jgi:hypothetical protein